MADWNGIWKWLAAKSWRKVHSTELRMVQRLVDEGRAEWVTMWNPSTRCARARAIRVKP